MNELLFEISLTSALLGAFVGIAFFFAAAMEDIDDGIVTIVWFFVGAVLFWGGTLTGLYGWLWSSTSHGLMASLIGGGAVLVIAGVITAVVLRDSRKRRALQIEKDLKQKASTF